MFDQKELVSGRLQMTRHGTTHNADANETDFAHDGKSLLVTDI